MANGDFKDLTKRKASDKMLHHKAFNIAKNLKYDGYQRGLVSMVYKFFDKNFLVVVLKMKISQTKNMLQNYTNQLLENSRKEKYTYSFAY